MAEKPASTGRARNARSEGFTGFVTFGELRETQLEPVPPGPGVYVVIRAKSSPPTFRDTSPAGRFKRKDPTELVDLLRAKWVDGADVIYIGKGDNLRRRLKQYAAFGSGRPVGHWGGRYIWQLADSDELLVAWRPCAPDESPAAVEIELVTDFKRAYGRLPFANITDASRRV